MNIWIVWFYYRKEEVLTLLIKLYGSVGGDLGDASAALAAARRSRKLRVPLWVDD